MKRIIATIALCIMLIAGCATAGQPEKQAAAKQTPQTATAKNGTPEDRLKELPALINAAWKKVAVLPLYKEREKRVAEITNNDPKIKEIDAEISKTDEFKEVIGLQREQKYLKQYYK